MKKQSIAIFSVMVILCSFMAFPAFANDHADSYQIKNINELTSDGNVRYQINASVFHMQRENTYVINNQSYVSYETEVLVTILLVSQSTLHDVYCDSLWNINLSFDSKQSIGSGYYTPYKITSVTPLSDNNFAIVNLVGADANSYTFALFPNPIYTNPTAGSRFVVPRGQTLVTQFKFTVSGYAAPGAPAGTDQYYIPTFVTHNLASSTWTQGDYPIQASYYTLYNQTHGYDEVSPSSSGLQNNSNGLNNQNDSNHQTELSYFNQTNQALSNSGIQNYQFSNDQINGVGSVSNDFTYVWNALGNWNTVYIFSITLSLALVIIRYGKRYKIE